MQLRLPVQRQCSGESLQRGVERNCGVCDNVLVQQVDCSSKLKKASLQEHAHTQSQFIVRHQQCAAVGPADHQWCGLAVLHHIHVGVHLGGRQALSAVAPAPGITRALSSSRPPDAEQERIVQRRVLSQQHKRHWLRTQQRMPLPRVRTQNTLASRRH